LLELNAHSRALRIDEDPFLLLGHPESRIVQQSHSSQQHSQAVDAPSLDRYRTHLYALGALLQNLRFSRDHVLALTTPILQLDSDIRSLVGNCGQHLRDIKRKGTSASPEEKQFHANAAAGARQLENSFSKLNSKEKTFAEQLERVSRTFSAQTLRFRSLGAISATPTVRADLEAFTAALLRTGQKDALSTLSTGLLDLWKQTQGYYYNFADNMERLFLPDSPFFTDHRCPSCGSSLLNKPQRYVGLTPTDSYRVRQQLVCPRCLVVRDASFLHSTQIESSFLTEGDKVQIEIRYRNQSRNPEWLFGYFHLNDPNNVSAHLSGDIFKRLLSGLSLSSNDWQPRTLAPGEMWSGVISVEGIPRDLFYLLVECHLFIDGCWNWLSFTRRAAKLDGWLESSECLGTLPQVSR
jgi:hypothetical protein